MFTEAYLDIIRYMEMGGDVLWYIAGLVCFMWTLIFERLWYFHSPQDEHKKLLFDATTKWEGRPERSSWTAHQVRDGIISEGASKKYTPQAANLAILSALNTSSKESSGASAPKISCTLPTFTPSPVVPHM